jgi:hypothetical protein
MRTQLRATAAALILLVALTGCSQTTGGTVAMTTEPGPPLTTQAPSSRFPMPGLPTLPRAPGTSRGPAVPAPPNALTMTCSEYGDLDEATQTAVVQAILEQQENPLGTGGADVAKPLADVMCQFLPTSTVNQVLLGEGPP